MKSFKGHITAVVIILLLLCILTGCGSKTTDSQQDKTDNKVEVQSKQINIKEIADQVSNGNFQALLINVEVTMPDYQKHFSNCYQRVYDEIREGETFSDALLRLSYKDIKEDHSKIQKTITVDLSDAQTDYSKWSDKELEEYIRSEALRKELELFFMSLIYETAPLITIN